jgi:hypothetical protein
MLTCMAILNSWSSKGESQCLDEVLNEYRDSRCTEMIGRVDSFRINHIPRSENEESNMLVQRASGYEVTKGLFRIREKTTSLGAQKRESPE